MTVYDEKTRNRSVSVDVGRISFVSKLGYNQRV